MGRYLFFVLLVVFAAFSGCSSGADCLRANGDLLREEVVVSPFSRIIVNEDIELIVTRGPVHKVVVQTGERLLDDFKAEVVNGALVLTMENTCNIIRKYNSTKVYVTTPDLTEIVSSTQFAVRSEEVLSYDRLKLSSISLVGDDSVGSGEFLLEVDVNELVVSANELANFEISGRAERLKVNLVDGQVRAYMPDLLVQEAEVYHRSSLDITIAPEVSVKGELWSTGNLVLRKVPPVLEVVVNYKGKVIYD